MLAGEAVVAIWNGIAPEARAQFYDWHTNEHMPESASASRGFVVVAATSLPMPTRHRSSSPSTKWTRCRCCRAATMPTV